MINKTDKFRNQGVILTIYVPVGKQIRVNKNVGWNNNIHILAGLGVMNVILNLMMWQKDGTRVLITSWKQMENCIRSMANLQQKWKHPKPEENDNNEKQMNNSQITSQVVNSTEPIQKIDSLKLKLETEQKNLKDSLQKAKEK